MTGITKAFPGVQALAGVSLDLHPGTIHALAGENGSGKSTLAKILYGALRPDSGSIEFDGEAVTFVSPGHALKYGIVAISQELTLASTLSVTENILMGRLPKTRLGRVDWKAAHRAARVALRQLDVQIDESQRTADLSVELQQQVEIVRAVSANSRVLILDEATSSLSEAAAERLLSTLHHLCARGVAVLFISHRLRELYACSDRATVLRDGQEVGVFPLPGTSEAELVTSMVGRPLADLYGKRQLETGPPIIRVTDLRTADDRVRDVSFTISAGEIVGIAGLVGSGKAELALALGGAIPSRGAVAIAGKPVHLSSPRQALTEGVGFVPDDRKRSALLPTRSVRHNLSLSWLRRLARYGILRSRAERAMVAETLGRFAIRTSSSATKITQLSGGNQQKVVLGRVFALDPRVVVLSEPTRGIDVGAKSEVYRLIQKMAQQGAGVILVSSELPELRGLCDRILVMFRGKICGEFQAQSAREEDIAHVALTGDRAPAIAAPR